MKKTKTREALYSDFLYPKKCRRSQPSPVSPNAGCWTIHLASACNCSILTSSKFLFLTTSASWQKMFSNPEVELLSLEFLSAIFTLLNVHTRDDKGHMTKIEAFTADDSRSCNQDRFSGEKRHKEAYQAPCICFNVLFEAFRRYSEKATFQPSVTL